MIDSGKMSIAAVLVSVALMATGCDNNSGSTSTAPDNTGRTTEATTRTTDMTNNLPGTMSGATTKPDNTAANAADRNGATLTPVDQSNDAADIKITADVRKAVTDDNSLSMNAHNAKIITRKGGVVTLRGVVDTAAEKDALETKAKGVAGVTSVDNELTVKTP